MFAHDSGQPDRWRWPIALLLLGLFAFVLRWYYVATAMVIQPVRGDAIQYVNYAWNLLTHHTFAQNLPGSASLTPDNYRDPGYPLFLAVLMKAFGTGDAWYAAVLLSQAMLGALTVVLATHLGKHWLTGRWALAAGVLMALWPHSITITGVLLSETLVGFLCAAALLAFATACQRQSPPWALAGGLMFGAVALTNAVLLPFGALFAAFLAWRKLVARTICMALAIGSMLLPGAWAVRNMQLPPSTATHSSLDRALQNFVQGASPDFHKAYRDSFFGDTAAKESASHTLQKVNAEYALLIASPTKGAKAFLQKFFREPLRYTYWYLAGKPHELWGWSIAVGQGDIYVYPTVNSPFMKNRAWVALEALCEAANLFIFFIAVASSYFIWSQRNFEKICPHGTKNRAVLVGVFLLTVFITVVYSALQAEPRYSIPFRSFEILLAITSLAGAGHFWHAHRCHK